MQTLYLSPCCHRNIILSYMLLSLLFSLLASIAKSNSNYTTLELSKFTQTKLTDNWQTIQKQLLKVNELIISYSGLSQSTLSRVLSLNMSSLKVLTFTKYHFDKTTPISYVKGLSIGQFLNRKLLKIIFLSDYIQNLIELNLVNTNLDHRSLQFLAQLHYKSFKLNLQSFKIGSNYLNKQGFQLLSLIQFPSLKKLDISGNSLIQQQSIDSLIRILCPVNQTYPCQGHLQSLDISSTNINRQGFIRILRAVDTRHLKHLNISNNNLHQSERYQNGQNLTAFSTLVQSDLGQLVQLQMNDMAIDGQIMKLFEGWRLPKLQSLVLFANFIEDQGLMRWLTVSNFPSLKKLILYNNYLTDSVLKHIETQNFTLTQLNVGFNYFTYEGLQHITSFSYGLQKLYLKQLKLQSIYLQSFLQNGNFSDVRQLVFSGNSQIDGLFSYFPWQKIPKLQKLVLTDCNIKDSLSFLFQNSNILAPNLKLMLFNNTGLSSNEITRLLFNIQNIFPNLQFIDLIQPFVQPINFTIHRNFDISEQLTVDLGYVSFRKTQQKTIIFHLSALGTLALTSLNQDLSEYFDYPQQTIVKQNQQKNKSMIPAQICSQVANSMLSLFDFFSLLSITIKTAQQFQLFMALISHQQKQAFVFLDSLLIQCKLPILQILKLLNNKKSHFTHLRVIKLLIIIDQNQRHMHTLVNQLNQFHGLTTLKLKFIYQKTNKNKYNFNSYLNQLGFSFLQTLQLSQSQLTTQQIAGLFHHHSHTLRNINLNNNFLQKSFFNVMVDNQATLVNLDLSFISFSIQQISLLSDLNTLHLKALKLVACELNSNHFVSLFKNWHSKHALFPSLALLLLSDNDISQEGTKALFESGLPQLSYLKINRNFNPNFINIVLSYSTKLHQLSAIGTDVYALSRTLIPRATRRVNYLSIATTEFSLSDFEILGSLQYRKLIFSQIIVKEVYECQLLLHILKINRFASRIVLNIENENPGLNASCLAQNEGFSSQVEEILVTDKHESTLLSHFLLEILRSQRYLKSLMLYHTRAAPEIFLSIDLKRLKHIKIINIPKNYLNDEGFQWILNSPLTSLTFLDISYNEVTFHSFQKLTARALPFVQQINFSGLLIGDKGIQTITSMKLPRLKRFFIMSCGITNLDLLNRGSFPSLVTLGLQRNLYNSEGILHFLGKINRSSFPRLQNLSFKGLTLVIEEYNEILKVGQKLKLRIELEHPYYLKHTNGAHI